MDKYAITCIFILIIQCVWYGVIGAVIFQNTADFRVTPEMTLAHVDQYVFFIALGIFIITHAVLLAWLWLVPLKHRRVMQRMEMEYRLSIATKKNRKNTPTSTQAIDKISSFSRIPIEK